MAYGRKSGGFSGNMVKLGGKSKKLDLKSDMSSASTVMKKAGGKSAHKKV